MMRLRIDARANPLSAEVIAKTVIVMALWASCFPLINLGSAFAPPFYFAGLRALFAGILILGPAYYFRRPGPTTWVRWFQLVALGLLLTSIGFWGMFFAGRIIDPGIGTVLANTQPLIAALIAVTVLHERAPATVTFGMLVGFIGIVIIGLQGMSDIRLGQGIGFVLLGSTGIAVGNVLLKAMAGKFDTFVAIGWQLVFGSIPLLMMAVARESFTQIDWSLQFTVILTTLSSFGTALVFLLWYDVLQKASLTQVNAFSFLTPILGLIIGILFFGEQFTTGLVIGIGITVAGLALVIRSS